MPLNPFSQRIGRRRAAMIGGDAPNDDAPALETEKDWPAESSPGGDGRVDSGDNGKNFGFAYRTEMETAHRAIETTSEQGMSASVPDEVADDPSSVTSSMEMQESIYENGIAGQQTRRPPSALPTDLDGPVVNTPHIERLRAQFGSEVADAVEPWLAETAEETSPTTQELVPTLVEPSPPQGNEINDKRGTVTADSDSQALHPDHQQIGGAAISNGTCQEASAQNADEQDLEHLNPIEDVAVTIGRVVSIRGSVIWGALFDDIDGQASRAARMGALVSMRGPQSRVFGIVNRLEREQQGGSAQSERTVFEIQVLGEIADGRMGFQRGVSSYPPLDAPVTTITIRDIATIYARPRSSNVHIGQLRHNPRVPAFVLTDSLLGKHFAVLGTTGTGKSCATTVILRSILDEHPLGHIVLLDPHNEYGPAFADRAELLNPDNLQLPYWLLNFEEIAHILLGSTSSEQLDSQGTLLKNAIIQAKTQFAGGDHGENVITVDTPLPYRLSDLVSSLKESMGMFNKAEGSSLYLSLINRIESLRADKRYAFMFSSLAVRDNMEQVLAQLLRIPTNGKPITIIDISGLPSEVVDVAVSVLFRLTFELAVWSERGKAPPVLLVCEEAHRYVPEESDVGFAPTKRVIAQIAKEGRKYGVTLCLVSQRPSELAVNSLAQCNTIFALRLSNEHDQAFVSQTLPENARWLVDSLPSLNTQEAVVVGDGVTVPVHIRFKNLAVEHRPASHDPSFAKSWCQEADDSFLGHAIDRWRRQTR